MEDKPGQSTSDNSVSQVDLSALNLSQLDRNRILELIGRVHGNIIVHVAGMGDGQVITATPVEAQEVAVMSDLEVMSASDLEQLGVEVAGEISEGKGEGVGEVVLGVEDLGHTYATAQRDSSMGQPVVGVAGQGHSLHDLGHTYSAVQNKHTSSIPQQQQAQVLEVHYGHEPGQYHIVPITSVSPSGVVEDQDGDPSDSSSAVTEKAASIPVPEPTPTPQDKADETAIPVTNTPSETVAVETPRAHSPTPEEEESVPPAELPEELRAEFVDKPDFSSQEYYDWLSTFTEVLIYRCSFI